MLIRAVKTNSNSLLSAEENFGIKQDGELRPIRRRGAWDAFAPPFWANYFKIMQFLAYTPNSDPKMVIFLKIRTPFQKTACVPGYYDRRLPVTSAIKHISTQDCIACNYCKGVYTLI